MQAKRVWPSTRNELTEILTQPSRHNSDDPKDLDVVAPCLDITNFHRIFRRRRAIACNIKLLNNLISRTQRKGFGENFMT